MSRVARPRAASAAPAEPVLLVGADRWWATCGLERAMGAADWTWIEAADVDRARWLVSIRRVSVVVIAGDRAFCRQAVDAVRALADAPLAVVTQGAADVVDLVAAGVDVVVGSDEPSATVLARLAAVIRRADVRRGPGVRYLRADDLTVDLWTQQCTLAGAEIALSPIEYDLLTFLMTRPAVTMSTGAIIGRVWGHSPVDGRNALRIVVNRLRRKLGDDPRTPRFVAAVRGSGYRFVANVSELADSLVDQAARTDVTPLLHSITTLAERLASAGTESAAAEVLVDVLDSAGVADAMALFRNDGARMRLVAVRRMPGAWLDEVADGVPFDPSFASAQSVLTGEVVQFADARAVKHQFGSTSRRLSTSGFRAAHFVPIARDGRTWGHLGLVRRSAQPLDAVTMAYLRSLCATFLLHIDHAEP